MDIYGAEIQVNKLLNYVKELSNSKPRMYRKSKDRLRELANTCNEVVAVIAEILQDEVLVEDTGGEFEGSNSSDICSVLNSMESQISELRTFLNASSSNADNDVVIYDDSSVILRREAMYNYKNCLQHLSTCDMVVQEAEDCGKLLWSWFSSRFLTKISTFKYNMKKFPDWIRDFVVLYGYHLESDTIEQFVNSFREWLLSIGPGMDYAIPYEVYQLDNYLESSKMTLTAVVIWDILLDCGLRDLCFDSSSEFYPSEDCVYSLVGSLNSSVMDPYKHYKFDKSILSYCNLTLKVGDEK